MIKLVLIFLGLFSWPILTLAQIGVSPTVTFNGAAGASYSFSFTVPVATHGMLCVGISIVDGAQLAHGTGVTWNTSENLTLVNSTPSGTGWNTGSIRTEQWCELSPTSGTHTIAVTLAAAPTGGASQSITGAVFYSRVNQSLTPDGLNNTSAGNSISTQPGGTVTTTATYDVVFDTVVNGNTTNMGPTSPSVQIWNLGFGTSVPIGAASVQVVAAAGVVTMAWTGAAGNWAQSIIGLKWDGTFASPTTYFLSPTGNDTNPGTLVSPWLTPKHIVNCGDVIQAAASSSYSNLNFRYGNWGLSVCINKNNVAWLQCVTFDACKLTASGSQNSIAVDSSYWGVQGWEVTATNDNNACFVASPPFPYATGANHIIFANDIANGCYNGGFTTLAVGTAGVDYLVLIGDISYNGAQSTASCTSGFDIVELVPSDTLPGTHLYIAGDFSWSNVDHNPCAGGTPTDGEGIALDTFDGSGGNPAYNVQSVIDNSIVVSNGGRGIVPFKANGGTYIRQVTLWNNSTDSSQSDPACGEIVPTNSTKLEVFLSISATAAATACNSNTTYSYFVLNGNGTVHVYNTTAWSAAGNYSSSSGSSGYSFGPNNLTNTTLSFTNAVTPGAPSCGSFASVPACMATVIANFTPTAVAAKAYGYQPVSTVSRYDPLYPQWLCTVTNLPTGLVTPGCLTGSAMSSGTTLNGGTIH